MKLISVLIAMVLLFSVESMAQNVDLSPTIQPYCAYKTADSMFTGADSSFRTRLSNGALVNAYWIRVRRSAGLDSAVVYVHLTRNTLDTNARYPIYFNGSDIGVECAYLFNKIYKSGTTPGVIDSLLDWGPKLNLDNYQW
jgi:hypothetical protein